MAFSFRDVLKKAKTLLIESDIEGAEDSVADAEADAVDATTVTEEAEKVPTFVELEDLSHLPEVTEEEVIAEELAYALEDGIDVPNFILPAQCMAIAEYRACRDVAAKVVEGYPVYVDFAALDGAATGRAFDFLGGVIYVLRGVIVPISDTVVYLCGAKREGVDFAAEYEELLG